MPRFSIYDCVSSVEGSNHHERWNGWACPYFDRAQAEALVAQYNRPGNMEPRADGQPAAWFDEVTRSFCFYCAPSDETDCFPPRVEDGVEVWDIGAWCWTWEVDEEPIAKGDAVTRPADTDADGFATVMDVEGFNDGFAWCTWDEPDAKPPGRVGDWFKVSDLRKVGA